MGSASGRAEGRGSALRAISGLALGFVVATLALSALPVEDPCNALPQLGFVPPVPEGLPQDLPAAALGEEPLFRERKDGETRIFVCGASLTYALPYEPNGAASFATLLEKGYRAVLQRDDFHVRPDAFPAVDSPQVIAEAKKCLAWGATHLLVVLGANEYINRVVYGRALIDDGVLGSVRDRGGRGRILWTALGDRVRSVLPEILHGAPLKAKAADFTESLERAAPGRPSFSGWPIGAADHELLMQRLRRGMREIARLCAAKGVSLVFVLSVHGFDGAPPWCSEIGSADPDVDRLVARVIEAPNPAELPLVLAQLRAKGERADLLYAKALLLRRLGRGKEAHSAFVKAQDLDLAPIHQTSEVRATMRSTAKELGVRLVELNRALEDENGNTGPGRFLDYGHVDLSGHQRIALFLARELAGKELPALPGGHEAEFREAMREQIERKVKKESIQKAKARMALNNGRYYMMMGNFRDALPFLERAAAGLDEASARHSLSLCKRKLAEAAR